MSAIVPAPTAWTEAADPPDKTRIIINMVMELLSAAAMFHIVKDAKETMKMVRRPSVSENEDHHRGNILMDSMYRATERLVIVCVVSKSLARSGSAAINCS
jgi:hypothetical protein